MKLNVTVQWDDEDGPRQQRSRVRELLGGLLGHNDVLYGDLDAYDTSRRVYHRLVEGQAVDLKFCDHAIDVLHSMRTNCLDRSKPQWWRENGCPEGHEIDLAATFLQNADRIAEVIGMVRDLRLALDQAESKLGINSTSVPSPA